MEEIMIDDYKQQKGPLEEEKKKNSGKEQCNFVFRNPLKCQSWPKEFEQEGSIKTKSKVK